MRERVRELYRWLRLLFLVAGFFTVTLGCVSCTGNFQDIPETGFIVHRVENKSSRIPFDSYWNADDGKTWDARAEGVGGQKIVMSVAPVDIKHIDVQPSTKEGWEALCSLAEYFRSEVIDSMNKKAADNPHFELVEKRTKKSYTLELAIISITPTNARAGMFVTALSTVRGGMLVKKFIKSGHIAMAGRLRDERGRVVSEFADYEEDHSSWLGIDFKDFEKYSHHRHTIDEWAREIADVYSTAYGHRTFKWMETINPF